MKNQPKLSQILIAASLLAFAFSSGCTCSGDVTTDGDPSISFQSHATDDIISDVDAEGNASVTVEVQVVGDVGDVELSVVGKDGSAVKVSPSSGLAVFENFILATGQHTLRARASSDPGGSCTGDLCQEISVVVLGSGCVVTSPGQNGVVTGEQAANSNAEGDDSYDPIEINIVATCVNVIDGTTVTLLVNGTEVPASTVFDNSVTFERNVVQEGENTTVITTSGVSYSSQFTVNTGGCQVSLGLDPQPEAGNQVNALADSSAEAGLQHGFAVATDCGADATYRLQWARVGTGEYANVSGSGAAGSLESAGADGSYTISGTGVVLPESNSPNDINLTVEITAADGRKGWAIAAPYYFDSVAPDVSTLSDADLGINECFQSGNATISGIVSAEPAGQVWIRVFDRETGDTTCDPADAAACDASTTAGDTCLTAGNGSYCRVSATIDAQGNFSAAGLEVPAGAVTVEYVPVDAIGNIGAPQTIERDIVSTDAGASGPAAAVLQVGTQLINEVVTAEDGSKSFNSVVSGDVMLNLGDRSGTSGFDVALVIGALNVPLGSIGTVTVNGVAAGTFTIEGGATNTYASSTTNYSVTLAHTDGETGNAIHVTFSAPAASSAGGLNCLVDALAASATVLADASQPQLLNSGLLVTDGSCNTPAVGEDGTNGVSLSLGGVLGAATEAGTTVTVSIGTCTDTCALGTCVAGGCQLTTTVTDHASSAPAFTFGTVKVPAGEAPNYNVALNYVAADPNGNSSDVVSTSIQLVPVVSDFTNGFGFQQPSNGEFLARDSDDSPLDAGLQYVTTVTGTPGAIYAGGETVSLAGSSGITVPSEVSEGSDVWSWSVTMADGLQTLTATSKDFCDNSRSITNNVVVYTDRPDMSLSVSFSDASSSFDESSANAVTGASQMVISVNTGAAPLALQALPVSDFVRKVRYTVYHGTKSGAGCVGSEVARNTLTPASVSASTSGKVFDTIDLATDISALGVTDDDGVALSNLMGQPVCVAVTSHDSYLGTEANEQTAAVGFTQRNVAPSVISLAGNDGVAIADGTVLTIDHDLDADLGNGFSINLSPALAAGDSADGTLTLVINAAGTGFDSTTTQALSAGATSAVFGPNLLPAGSASLEATYTDAYGNTSEAYSIQVTVPQGDGPSIEVTYPTHGSTIRSDALNRVNIGLLAGSAVTPASCDVSVAGVLVADDVAWGAVNSLQVDLSDTDYPDGALDFSVSCEAASGVSSTLPLTISIDDTAPSTPILSQTVWVDGSGSTSVTLAYASSPTYVNCSFVDTVENPLGECTRSLQHAITIRVDPNQTNEQLANVGLVLTATYGIDGSITTYNLPSLESTTLSASDGTTLASPVLISAIAGRYDLTILNVDFGSADQDVTFSVKLVDAAGNESGEDSETVTVDRTGPSFAQTNPSYEAPPAVAVLRQFADAFPANGEQMDLDFRFQTSGLAAGANVDLTLTHESQSFTDLRDNILVNGATLAGISDFTISGTVDSLGAVEFSRLTFSEAFSILPGFTISVSATDAAGNASEGFTYNFYTLISDPALVAAGDAQGGVFLAGQDASGVAGFQTDIFYNGIAIGNGTTVTLCSTASVANGGGTVPCRWGFPASAASPSTGTDVAPGTDPTLILGEGADNTLLRGFVIGTATSIGAGFTNFVLQTLPEGEQWIHAEVGETGAVVNTTSSFYRFTVDAVVPVISAIELTANDASNDLEDGTTRLSAGMNEISGSAGEYSASVRVRVEFSNDLDGRTVTVSNDGTQATGTLAQVGDALEAVVSVRVTEGTNSLTATVSDSSGNLAETSPTLTFTVDSETPSTLVLDIASPSAGSVYNASDFPVLAALLAADPQDQSAIQAVTTAVLDDAIVVNFSGESSVVGSKATVQLFDADGSSNPSALYESETVVSENTTQIVFSTSGGGGPAVPLSQGLEQLQVVFTDGVGNSVTMNQQLLQVDFKPPELSMALMSGGADVSSSCADNSDAAVCLADLKDLGGGSYQNGNKQCVLDGVAGNGCPADLIAELGSGACNDVGTDIFFTLRGCSNSDATLEGDSSSGTCGVAMALQSRTSGGIWAAVDSGGFTKTADEAVSASYLAQLPSDALINPAIVREFRLQATDTNGNVSISSSVFVKINNPGTTLDGYLRTPVTGTRVDLVSGLSISSNLVDASTVDLDFVVTPTVGGDTPIGVQVVTNGLTSGAVREDGNTLVATVDPGSGTTYYTATFTDFTVPTVTDSSGAGFELAVTILCEVGGTTTACGTTTYSDLKADTAAPTFQFERCSLHALGVPMDIVLNATSCTSETNSANVAANITQSGLASWNVALDAGSSSDGVFSFDSNTAIGIDLYGLTQNVDVTLVVTDESSGAALSTTNVSATSTGCASGASSCSVRFTNFTIQEPSDGTVVLINASFTDPAGNTAVAMDPRTTASERIRVSIDATPPASVAVTACSGESTTPNGVGSPSSDPATFEDTACATHCTVGGSCNRRLGEAVLAFAPVGDDGTSGSVSSYNVKVAALEIPYGDGVQYTACSKMTSTSPTEDTASSNANSGLTLGSVTSVDGTSYVSISGLLPHRSYCFAVEALDNAGNVSDITGMQVEREFYFVNGESADDMVPSNPTVDGGQAYIDYLGTDAMESLAVLDFDGDGSSDVILSRFSEVELYLSTLRGTSDYPISIGAGANGSAFFAYSLTVGNFDGDAFDDIAIGDPFAQALNGDSQAGGVHVFFGRDDSGSATPWWNVTPTDNNHPSIAADVSLLGAGSTWTGVKVAMVNVDENAGDELVFSVPFDSTGNRALYGFAGGSRAAFTASSMGVVASGPGDSEIAPDFAITGYTGGVNSNVDYGAAIEAADVNGDGINELVFSDYTIAHSPVLYPDARGEVYIFTGGTLSGSQSLSAPTSLMHTLRRTTPANFGAPIAVISSPRAGDSADWLAITALGQYDVSLYKGTSNPSSDPAVTAGLVPASYESAELAGITPVLLEATDWAGGGTDFFGSELTTVNLGRDYLVSSSGSSSSGPIMFYSYDASSDSMSKQAVIPGSSAGHASKIKGASVNSIGNLIILNKTGYDSIRIQ